MSPSTEQASQDKNPAPTPADPRPPVGEDAVLEVLAEFQEGLESLRSLYQERTAMSARLTDREADLANEAQRLAAAQAELKRNRAEVEAIRESVEQARRAVEESRRDAEVSRREVDQLAGKLASRQTELNKNQESIETRGASLEAAAAELATRQAAAAESLAEQDSLRTRILELESAVAESKSALATQQARAAEQEVALRREFEGAMKSRTDSAKAGAPKADEALRAELEAVKNRLASQQGALEEHAKALTAERAEKQRLTRELAAAQTVPSKGGSENERPKLEKAARALIELRTERDEMTAQTQRLKKELDAARKAGAASAQATGHNDAIVELRRSRLKRYRQMVRDQSHKVLKATENLKSRFEHAEKLNAQREQLAEASEKIKIAQRKIEGQRSKVKTAAVMFYALSSALVLAVGSWMLTGWLTPGTYVASTVVSAQGRGRTLNAAELGEWQAFHQHLINDPRFHEVVAERMSRRGLSTLATPGAVRELVSSNVNTRSVEDGELVIEMRGDEGPERTARVLETLTTALASHANAARQQRVDGAVTTIKQAAQAGSQPIDNTRFMWAGGVWLMSLAVTGVAGWFLWKRLSNAKVSFEKSSNVDELLDEAKWLPPAMATQMRRDRRMLP